MWTNEDNVGRQPIPTLATYTEAMNRFTRSASAFMQHVHLLTEARDAYQEAMTASKTLRRSLDDGDQTLRSVMTQLEQVVNEHFGEPVLDGKKLEPMEDATGTESVNTRGGKRSLP
jgi:exonuclease VII small subunit